MGARRTLERILRDDDDATGQTIRKWFIARDGDHLTIRRDADSVPLILIRTSDAEQLAEDLTEMAELAP